MMQHFSKIQSRWWLLLGLVLLLTGLALWLWPVSQPASAEFVLQLEDKKVEQDEQFEVKLIVNSTLPANAVDAVVSYPMESLEVVSTSSKDSRFDMVLFPARADNQAGQVRFVQATAVPFSGDNGLVGKVTFKAKKDVTVELTTEGKIIANDSEGTNLAAAPEDKRLWQVVLGQ